MNESVFEDPQGIVCLADIIDPKRGRKIEAEEGYRIPNRVRILSKMLDSLESQEREYSLRQQCILKKMEREATRADQVKSQLLSELDLVEERVRNIQGRIREAWDELQKERQGL